MIFGEDRVWSHVPNPLPPALIVPVASTWRLEQISLWEFIALSADPSLPPPTSAATAVNRLKNLVGAGSGRASGVDTDEEMATAAARTTISGE